MTEVTWGDILSNNKEISFIVNKKQMNGFLNELGNKTDEEGFIIDGETGKRVISQDEGEIKLNDLGSISSGSKTFIKKNIASYAEFLSKKRNNC